MMVFEKLRQLSFPSFGKKVGNFALYDSLLAGMASRYVQGESLDLSEVPSPDAETLDMVSKLIAKSKLTAEEKGFLDYFYILDSLKSALISR